MADEMTGTDRNYSDPIQAQLGERVTNLGRRQSDLEGEMRSGFKQIELSVHSLANETRQAIASLSSTMAERSRPQWQALGVALTFFALLGALAYWPIRESTGDLKSAVSVLAEKVVTQQEMQWRTQRGLEDRQRMELAVAGIREDQVPRKELERVWDAGNQRDADLQRQIDQLSASYSGTYGARDVILDLRERLDRLERTRTTVPAQ